MLIRDLSGGVTILAKRKLESFLSEPQIADKMQTRLGTPSEINH